jgi:hypothetical protein
MKKQVRAQTSMEFLVITGIGLLLITTVTYAFLQYNKDTADKATVEQVTSAGFVILQKAGEMHSYGANSWTTVEVNLPSGILAIYTVESDTLVFDVATSRGLVAQPVFSRTPIVGVREDGEKLHVNSGQVVIHDGPTQFRITSNGENVSIQAIS